MYPRAMSFVSFVIAVLLPQAVGGLSAVVTVRAVREWYPTLVRPSFAPPSWVFGPVWTLLYLMMGIASWLVWQRRGTDPRVGFAIALYLAQLLLNGLWTPVFFSLHALGWAFAVIVVLLVLIACTMVAFWRVTPVAGAMLAPYLAWVAFATALNFAFWRLNRG